VSGVRGLIPRLGAALLLVGFLAHAGDGLVSALCHPGQESSGHVVMEVDRTAGNHSADHTGEETPGDDPCPFGSTAVAACAGTATALTAAPVVRAPLTAPVSSIRDEPDRTSGVLLASGLFRPPRA
jgi:hypothetical protein